MDLHPADLRNQKSQREDPAQCPSRMEPLTEHQRHGCLHGSWVWGGPCQPQKKEAYGTAGALASGAQETVSRSLPTPLERTLTPALPVPPSPPGGTCGAIGWLPSPIPKPLELLPSPLGSWGGNGDIRLWWARSLPQGLGQNPNHLSVWRAGSVCS